MSNQMAGPTT